MCSGRPSISVLTMTRWQNRHPQYQPALHLHILRRQTDAFRLQAYAYHHQYRHHSPGTSRIGLRRLRGGGNCSCATTECPVAYSSTFSNAAYSNATLAVPRFCEEKYRSKTPWNKFSTIEGTLPEVPSGIESVGTEKPTDEAELYDLSGRRVTAPASPGIYILRHPDGSATKTQL